MVEDRVEVVLGRREAERDGVAERDEDGRAEHRAQRVVESAPERRGAVAEPAGDVLPSATVDEDRDADDGEAGEERPPRHPAEERQRPEHGNELCPRHDVRSEQERGGRPRRELRGDAERPGREKYAAGGEGERPGHRPLAEKCW